MAGLLGTRLAQAFTSLVIPQKNDRCVFCYHKVMTGQDIVAKIKELNLPQGSYIVYGSGPMAAAGIREAQDIDLLVNEAVFQSLRDAGWQQMSKGVKDEPLARDVFEAHASWEFSHYKPTLEHLLATATVIDGIPFASLNEVRKWKAGYERPKDLKDVAQIDEYLAQQR